MTPEPGRRTPTLRDVAERAGVHSSTASRALDPAQSQRLSAQTVERVVAAAEALGYAPDLLASGLKRGRSHTVGVVVADFENPFTGPLSRGIGSVLVEGGYVALVTETEEDPERLVAALRQLAQRRADAVIVVAAHLGDAQALREARATGTPIVLAIRGVPDAALPTVLHDDVTGARLAAEHLTALGHTRLAQLLGPGDIDTFQRRARGFAEGAARAGLDVHVSRTTARATTDAEGRRLTEALLASGDAPPTALFAPSDVMAVGAMEALADAGLRCPADVSVVGYNDVPLARHLAPRLTTIRLHSEELGRAAARLALALIADPAAEPDGVELAATLVERDSTAPPPSGV